MQEEGIHDQVEVLIITAMWSISQFFLLMEKNFSFLQDVFCVTS